MNITDTVIRRLEQMQLQVKASWHDALSAGCASGVAWFISSRILHHERPIYAAMTALICLAPGLPSHSKQAIYVLIGVLTGVLVGEATLLLPPMPTELRIALVGFIGLTIGSAYAIIPAIIIQAGLSAIMVFALGADVAGVTRLVDVVIGTSIGLLFSQILFTPNQVKALTTALERYFLELANNLSLAAQALKNQNVNMANKALKSCGRTHVALVALGGAIDQARSDARWSLRGRFSSREVSSLSVRYDRNGVRLYACVLLFCDDLLRALKKNTEPAPQWLIDAVELAAENCRYLSGDGKQGQQFVMPRREEREIPIAWRESAEGIMMAENALAHFYKSKTRKKRLLNSKRKKLLEAVRQEVSSHKDKSGDNVTGG